MFDIFFKISFGTDFHIPLVENKEISVDIMASMYCVAIIGREVSMLTT